MVVRQVVLVLSERAAKVLLKELRDVGSNTDEEEDILCSIIDEIDAQFKAQEEEKPKSKKGVKKRAK